MCSAYVLLIKPRVARRPKLALSILAKLVISASVYIASSPSFASSIEGIAAFNGGKFDAALKALRPLADGDDPVAQCYVARIFNAATGGVRRDTILTKQYSERALRGLTTKAAEGSATAQA